EQELSGDNGGAILSLAEFGGRTVGGFEGALLGLGLGGAPGALAFGIAGAIGGQNLVDAAANLLSGADDPFAVAQTNVGVGPIDLPLISTSNENNTLFVDLGAASAPMVSPFLTTLNVTPTAAQSLTPFTLANGQALTPLEAPPVEVNIDPGTGVV